MPFRLKSWPHIVFPPPIVFPLLIVFPCVVIKLFVTFSAAFRPGFKWLGGGNGGGEGTSLIGTTAE